MSKRVITLKDICHMGRWGNQLFQYCTGKGLARQYNAELQVHGGWIGRQIFNIPDPDVEQEYWQHINSPTLNQVPPSSQMPFNLHGYWQNQEAVDRYSRTDALNWLQWNEGALELLDRTPKYDVVLHKRRGDYVNNIGFCCITDQSYEKAIAMACDGKQLNVHVITEENPATDPYWESIGAGFLPDFMLMVKADIVIRSASTFSWWGPVLGNNKVISPVVGDLSGWHDVDWVWGNHPVMCPPKYHARSGNITTDTYLKP